MNVIPNIQKIQQSLSAYPHARLLVVTKKQSPETISQLWEAGVTMIGENHVQAMAEKQDAFPSFIEKHLIGHLQSNKVKNAVQLFDVIQSVDSLKIAEKIATECQKAEKIMPIFLQVNISKEEQKYGFLEEEIFDMYQKIAQLSGIFIQGLMCIPRHSDNKEEVQKYFKKMKQLHTKIIQKNKLSPDEFELSMGMSGDYKIALEEGATLIRVGSAIFREQT